MTVSPGSCSKIQEAWQTIKSSFRHRGAVFCLAASHGSPGRPEWLILPARRSSPEAQKAARPKSKRLSNETLGDRQVESYPRTRPSHLVQPRTSVSRVNYFLPIALPGHG